MNSAFFPRYRSGSIMAERAFVPVMKGEADQQTIRNS